MLILTERTPNPDTLRFILPKSVQVDGPREYRVGYPMPSAVASLLEIDGVESVLVAEGFVSVSRRSAAYPWERLTTDVILQLDRCLSSKEPWQIEPGRDGEFYPRSLIEQQIADILRNQVAPQVARDGGNIELTGFDEKTGVVTVALKGACGGCPSATITLKNGVEAILKRYVPEVSGVRAEAHAASPGQPFWRKLLGLQR